MAAEAAVAAEAAAAVDGGDTTTPPVAETAHNARTALVARLAPRPGSSPGGKLVINTKVNGPGLVTGKATSGQASRSPRAARPRPRRVPVKVTLKPTKAGKRLLKSKRSVKVKVKLAFKPTTGATVVQTVNARLRAARFKG